MTDKEILNLAQAELRAMYKQLGINGSNVLTLIDEALHQPPVSGQFCECIKEDWDGADVNGNCVHCGKKHK